MCPGEDFARMVLLLYITQILLKYELRLPKDVQHTHAHVKPSEDCEGAHAAAGAILMTSEGSPEAPEGVEPPCWDADPCADPVCGFTASPRPYRLVLFPRL